MTDNERMSEMHQDVKDIRSDLKNLDDKLDKFAESIINNKNDIKWLKASLKTGLGFTLSILVGVIGYLVKSVI